MAKLNGLIISSGLSSRMGKFKPLLTYQSVPFIINIFAKLSTICKKVIIVLGHKQDEIRNTIFEYQNNTNLINSFLLKEKISADQIDYNKIEFVFNEKYEKGMFTSLKAGLNISENAFTIYHFVDQPHIPIQFYKKIIKQNYSEYEWLQPSFRERNGHPIILGQKVKDLILSAPEDSNLRAILKDSDISRQIWDCDFPQILDDIDTPKDYQGIC